MLVGSLLANGLLLWEASTFAESLTVQVDCRLPSLLERSFAKHSVAKD